MAGIRESRRAYALATARSAKDTQELQLDMALDDFSGAQSNLKRILLAIDPIAVGRYDFGRIHATLIV
jgi:hypothetical protein